MPSDAALKAAREILRDVFAYPSSGDAQLEPVMAEIIDRHMPKPEYHDEESDWHYEDECPALNLKALLVEAAEAVETLLPSAYMGDGDEWVRTSSLVARLRKAAEELA